MPSHLKSAKVCAHAVRASRLRLAGYVLAALLPIYWCVIFVLTHVPIPQKLHASDKLAHFGAYLILSGLVSIYLGLRWRASVAVPIVAIAACAFYGALDEYTQQFVNRSTDFNDWLADMVGATVGAVSYFAFMHWRASRKQS